MVWVCSLVNFCLFQLKPKPTMTLSVARTMKLSIFLFFKKFNSSKWSVHFYFRSTFLVPLSLSLLDFLFFFWFSSKTAAKMAVARIKLLRNKREAVVRQMRRDIALLLQSKQDATARIRVLVVFVNGD